uniref:Uncharacterized protein n=1 Tax=Panagrolaimus davidi TaxID=227884 RepID=A0A914Q2Y9_9BILA
MKTGVKLRKIDQLIEKFFYNGLRATNSTPVRVVSSSVISRYSSSSSYHHHQQHQYDHEKPSTSSLAEAIDASGGENVKHKEDGRDNNETEKKDKRINRDKNIMESNKAVNIRKRKADKIDKDDVTKDGDKEEEQPNPSTSKEVSKKFLTFR